MKNNYLTTPRYRIRALQAFVAAYQSGTTTEAGTQAGLPQSTVSQRIIELEGTIGRKLFERSHAGLRPTPHGDALYPRAVEILERLEVFADFDEGEVLSPPIKLLSFPRLAVTLVAPAIAEVCRELPEACFNVDLKSRRDLAHGRSTEVYDVMIMTMDSRSDDNPDKIGSVPLYVVMHPDHELSQHSKLSISDLSGRSMIQLEPGTLMRHISDQLFAWESKGPVTVIETPSSPYALEQAACGVGFFIVDGLVPERLLGDVRCIPFEGQIQGVDVILKRSTDCIDSPILDLFIELVTARLEEHLDHLPAAA